MSTSEKSALVTRRLGELACTKCGAAFVCGTQAGDARCWCMELPPLLPVPGEKAGCYCPKCLRTMIDAERDGKINR